MKRPGPVSLVASRHCLTHREKSTKLAFRSQIAESVHEQVFSSIENLSIS
jgi:hypothetical protein